LTAKAVFPADFHGPAGQSLSPYFELYQARWQAKQNVKLVTS
jgi:hypothetical protein